MKCLMCYYSSTGNTKLACDFIAAHIQDLETTFFNIATESMTNLDQYDIVGFAAFADFLGPSKLFCDFIRRLPRQAKKPAFVFNTFGNFNGATLKTMASKVRKKGFTVIAAHALHTPENIATMIMMGIAHTQAPNPKELDAFKKFIASLGRQIAELKTGTLREVRLRLFDRILPPLPRWLGPLFMGKKKIDTSLCNKCGICVKTCPYHAIEMKTIPE
ncbi:MAG: EFR1 family ferrodoxin, partial [Chitinivibrionales bacterium]|nr:EFR1 family ferrodoxin [Chitinivibrionales bacterium]